MDSAQENNVNLSGWAILCCGNKRSTLSSPQPGSVVLLCAQEETRTGNVEEHEQRFRAAPGGSPDTQSSLDFSELSEEIENRGRDPAGKPVASASLSSRHTS